MSRYGDDFSVAQDTDVSLVLTREFDAPAERVFRAWTEPEEVKRWWGPKGFTCPVWESDLRVGGLALSCMRSPEGQEFWSRGEYVELERPRRIVCTDSFSDAQGNVVSAEEYGMSADWPLEAQIAVTFEERDGRTFMRLEHTPLVPGPDRDMCREGWSESFDKLEEYLAHEESES